MDNFTLIDAVTAATMLISAILAYSRGFVRETLSIAGWVGAAVVAFIFAHQAEPLIKEIPVAGDFLVDSCELSIIAAFAAVFAVALIIVSLFTPLFSNLVQKSALGGFDQGLGFLFGLVRAAIIVAVAFVVYDRLKPGEGIEMVDASTTARIFAEIKGSVEEQIPTQAPEWILKRYEELTVNCAPGSGGAAATPSGTGT